MYSNIQFNKTKFEDLILHYVQRKILANERLGLGGIRNIPFNPLDDTSPAERGVIDHIEIEQIELEYLRGSMALTDTAVVFTPPLFIFGGTAASRPSTDLSIPQLVAQCNIGVFCIRETDLVAAGLNRADASKYTRFGIQASFKVSQPAISGSNLLINFSPFRISFGLGGYYKPSDEIDNEAVQELAEDLLEIMTENAEEWFPPVRFPVGNISSVFGRGYEIWNAGLKLSGQVIDLQLQTDRSDLVSILFLPFGNIGATWLSEWGAYYDGSLTDRLTDLDWGVFFPFTLFQNRIASTVETSLSGRDNVVLNSTSSTWHITNVSPGSTGCFPGEQGSVDTRIAVYLPGACIPWGYDMDVNLRLDTQVSVPREGVIRLDLQASHEVDPGDVFVCGSLNALLLSGAGVAIGGVFGGWIGAVAGGIVGGLTGGFATLGIILDQDMPSFASSELQAVPGRDNAYFTEIAIEPTNNLILGTVAITSLTPCHDGMFAGGMLTENPPVIEPLPDGAFPVPRWHQPGRSSCPSDGSLPVLVGDVGFSFYRDARLRALPLVLWKYEILEQDPEGLWPDPTIYYSSNSLVYFYVFSRPELERLRAAAVGDVPNLKLLFQTNAGARIFNLSIPAEALSNSAYTDLQSEIHERCTANQDLIDMFEDRIGHLRDILNGPRRLPEWINFDAIGWTVNFTDIDPRAKIALQSMKDNNVQHLGDLQFDKNGNGRMDLWLRGDAIKIQPQLKIAGMGKPKHGKLPGFMVGLMGFRTLERTEISGTWKDHALLRTHHGYFGTLLTENRLYTYRLDESGSLQHIHTQRVEGFQELFARYGRLWAINKKGYALSTENGTDWKLDKDLPNPQVGFQQQPLVLPQFPEASAPTALAGKFAWVLSENCDSLILMERLESQVGGFRYGSGASQQGSPEQSAAKC